MVEQSYALEHLHKVRFTRCPTTVSQKERFRICYFSCYQIRTTGFQIRNNIRRTWMNSKNWDFLSIEHEGNDFQTGSSYRRPRLTLSDLTTTITDHRTD